MDARQMKARCPNARRIGTAVLTHHRLQIDGRGVATVTACEGSSVHGVVWDITATDEASLDRYEGVPNYYVKQYFAVQFDDGAQSMLIYTSTTRSNGSPLSGYLERIIAAAEESDLPTDYVAKLRSWMIGPNA